MRQLLRPILLPLLRRRPDEVERQASYFSLEGPDSQRLVAGVGRAFLGGYHAMLVARRLSEVSVGGAAVERHFQPFFFEGAAMGYLPRTYFTRDAGASKVEAELLAMDPRFLYLYYVGLGFWFGFRHPGRPAALESLAPRLDPFYFPLCYDGYGFKLGFFDVPKRPARRKLLDEAPPARRAPIYQGFGRSLFFVCMDDEDRFRRAQAEAPAEHRGDLEAGRSLALTFTGLRRPERILRHLSAATEDDDLGSRLLGVTWALTARQMNDPDYFVECLGASAPAEQALFHLLPQRCREALTLSRSYDEWRTKTKRAVASAYAAWGETRGR
jgi:enediyne biosynthesis protein E3